VCGVAAPEIIRGEKYSEKADVYSFGMTMWQMATRKQPFAGRNFMGVSLDVLEGKRPQLPADCPLAFGKTVKRCWHAKPDKRPSMDEVLIVLNQLTGDHSLEDHDGDSSIVLP
jgi:serine/threonine protein kinase